MNFTLYLKVNKKISKILKLFRKKLRYRNRVYRYTILIFQRFFWNEISKEFNGVNKILLPFRRVKDIQKTIAGKI